MGSAYRVHSMPPFNSWGRPYAKHWIGSLFFGKVSISPYRLPISSKGLSRPFSIKNKGWENTRRRLGEASKKMDCSMLCAWSTPRLLCYSQRKRLAETIGSRAYDFRRLESFRKLISLWGLGLFLREKVDFGIRTE